MGFSLNNIKDFGLPEISRQFLPFMDDKSELPCCAYTFFCYEDEPYKDAHKLYEVNRTAFYAPDSNSDGIIVKSDRAIVHIHDDFSIADVFLPGKYRSLRLISYTLMHAYRYTAIHSGALIIHAAAVEYSGGAVLFCGLPGAGKSTQANLWEKYLGAEPINMDQPCIIFRDKKPYVSGTPWSGKEDCYKNKVSPVRAIVFVEQSKDNGIKKLSPAEAFSLLYLNNIMYFFRPDIEAEYTGVIESIVKAAPVYRLSCDISENAVKTLSDEVFGEYRKAEEKTDEIQG